MFKKRVLLSIVFASSNLIGMFGVLPGQVQSHAGAGAAAARLASISENPAAVATATAVNVADTKSGAEKKAKEPRPIKSLKRVATKIVVRKSRMKPGQVLELYGAQGFLRGVPFKQLHGISLAGLLKKEEFNWQELINQCSSWAVIDEKTAIVDQTK